MALCRRPAHGRGNAPADTAMFWHVRRRPSQSGRRAAPHHPAVEVRLQVSEGHCAHQLHRKTTDEYLATFRTAGIRFLFEREPARGPSPMESGQGTPPGRIPQTPDLDV